MSDDLRKQIYLNFRRRETEELLEIWRTNDRYEWSEMTFDVIREILQERQVELPPQGEPVYEAHKLKPAVVREDQQDRQVVVPPQDEPVHEAHGSEGVSPLRPKAVFYAVCLALAGLAVQTVQITVSLATGPFGAMAQPQLGLFWALLFPGLLGVWVFEAWLIYGIWLGRNRRRVLYIVWMVSSTVFMVVNGGWAQGLAMQPVKTAAIILVHLG